MVILYSYIIKGDIITRWSKSFGVTETCSVSDLVELKDIMQALNNINSVGRKCADMGLPHPRIVALEVNGLFNYNVVRISLLEGLTY